MIKINFYAKNPFFGLRKIILWSKSILWSKINFEQENKFCGQKYDSWCQTRFLSLQIRFWYQNQLFKLKSVLSLKINLRGQEILGSKIYFAKGNLFWSRKLSWGKKSILRYKIYPGVKNWFLGIEIDAHRLNNPHTNQATYFRVQVWLN